MCVICRLHTCISDISLCVLITWSPKPRPQHTDDVIEVRSLRLADTGSYVDQDDEVAEVLEDREVVSPHVYSIAVHYILHVHVCACSIVQCCSTTCMCM